MKLLRTGVDTLVDPSGWPNPNLFETPLGWVGKLTSNELRKPTESSCLLLRLGASGLQLVLGRRDRRGGPCPGVPQPLSSSPRKRAPSSRDS